MSTDRPTFTPSSRIVPRGRLQVESGYTFTHDLTARVRDQEHLFPELAIRLGLTDRIEADAFWPGQSYDSLTRRDEETVRRRSGATDPQFGLRLFLFEQEGWRPRATLITRLSAPVEGRTADSSDGVEVSVVLAYGWELTERLTLAGSTGLSNAIDRGLAEDTLDSYEEHAQSLVASFGVTDKVTVFHEWFVLAATNAEDNRPEHYMNAGLLYRLTPNLQLDLRAGFGLGDRPDDFFSGAGLSFRY